MLPASFPHPASTVLPLACADCRLVKLTFCIALPFPVQVNALYQKDIARMAGEKGAAPMEDEYKSFLAELGGKDPRAAGGETSRPGLGSGEDLVWGHLSCGLGLQGLFCRGRDLQGRPWLR